MSVRSTLWLTALCMSTACCAADDAVSAPQVDETAVRKAVTFYASFDERLEADRAGGEKSVQTRSDDPQAKGRYVVTPGYPKQAFRIDRDAGISGGALQAVDVLPRRGRLFFPAKGNIRFQNDGWQGGVSFWLKTNPDTRLKTRYCDPVQITQRRAGDGGLWIDFPDTKPRSLRLGAFRALGEGEKAISEKDPAAPLIVVPKVGFQEQDWHHLAMTWRNFDSGRKDARATLYIDGKRIASLEDRNIAMNWEIRKTGIYVAVSYIGLMDEFAVFDRELTSAEVSHLQKTPDLLVRQRR